MESLNPQFVELHTQTGCTKPDTVLVPNIRLQRGSSFHYKKQFRKIWALDCLVLLNISVLDHHELCIQTVFPSCETYFAQPIRPTKTPPTCEMGCMANLRSKAVTIRDALNIQLGGFISRWYLQGDTAP